MTPDELYTQAKESPVLSKEVTDTLLESLEYSSISFLNQAVEILGIFRARLERGDRITVEASGDVLNLKSFRKFVENTFSDYIYGHVFTEDSEQKRSYFHLDACEGGYSLVLAEDGKQNLFEWISSPNERFSFVYMKATKIVYIKNIRTGDYFPFISENGKYCGTTRYRECLWKYRKNAADHFFGDSAASFFRRSMSYADSFRVQQTFLSVQLIQIVLAERFYTIFRQGFNGFFIVPYP